MKNYAVDSMEVMLHDALGRASQAYQNVKSQKNFDVYVKANAVYMANRDGKVILTRETNSFPATPKTKLFHIHVCEEWAYARGWVSGWTARVGVATPIETNMKLKALGRSYAFSETAHTPISGGFLSISNSLRHPDADQIVKKLRHTIYQKASPFFREVEDDFAKEYRLLACVLTRRGARYVKYDMALQKSGAVHTVVDRSDDDSVTIWIVASRGQPFGMFSNVQWLYPPDQEKHAFDAINECIAY